VECKSYIEWPQWDYRRVSGLGKVQLNDIVVFNYPAGDTICGNMPYQTEYYHLCYQFGRQAYEEQRPGLLAMMDSMPKLEQLRFNSIIYQLGKSVIANNWNEFGDIDTRPTDRRENYVKRCVGLPGQTLQIKNRIVYLDGKANKEPDNVQYTYYVKLRQGLPDELMQDLGISMEDLMSLNQMGYMPLTQHAVDVLGARKDLVESIRLVTEASDMDIYPLNGNKHWTRDNYGPVWIPKKGETLKLTLDNLPVYERPIRTYEGNQLDVRDGRIYINGKEAKEYTFKLDYYWMQGDNRHNSADSRYWGFVPEDHIVGKPIFIWWSSDPDRRGVNGIRWNRLFRFVDDIK
jgi:signal peptidase I